MLFPLFGPCTLAGVAQVESLCWINDTKKVNSCYHYNTKFAKKPNHLLIFLVYVGLSGPSFPATAGLVLSK